MRVSHIGLVALLAGMASSTLAVPVFHAVSIPPIPGGTASIGLGVNDAGWVVGQADGPVAFVYHDGASEALPLLAGGSDAAAVSINNHNVIVGTCHDTNGVSRAVKWEQVEGTWTITDLGTFAADNAGMGVATRINDAGQITGYATLAATGAYKGFIMTNGVKVNIGTLNFTGNFSFSQALGLNDNGEVSGYAYATLQGPEHGLFWSPDHGSQDITPLYRFGLAQWHNVTNAGVLGGYISGSPEAAGHFRPAMYDPSTGDGIVLLPMAGPGTDGYSYDINESNTIVGEMFYLNEDETQALFFAFMNENGNSFDLNTVTTGLPATMTVAKDISNSGLIVGSVDNGPNGPQAVLLIPGVACPADFNADGVLDFFDYLDFVDAFASEDSSADYNHDRVVDFFDYLDFVDAFSNGC